MKFHLFLLLRGENCKFFSSIIYSLYHHQQHFERKHFVSIENWRYNLIHCSIIVICDSMNERRWVFWTPSQYYSNGKVLKGFSSCEYLFRFEYRIDFLWLLENSSDLLESDSIFLIYQCIRYILNFISLLNVRNSTKTV